MCGTNPRLAGFCRKTESRSPAIEVEFGEDSASHPIRKL